MKMINNLPKLANLNEVENKLLDLENNKATTNHASANIDYGTGSDTKYGHVKVSDNYKTSAGVAAEGVAASSKAVADVYAEVNSMKSTYQAVAFATGNDTVTLPAGTAQKIGSLAIPANCIAVLTFNANNRSPQPDLEFGITLQEAVTDVRWCGMHQKVTQFYSLSDTWMYYNNSNSDVNVNLFGKASIATTLQYVTLSAICTPIIN